ncbi:glycoside hydrolase [Pluteus cervinus]|uniref:Glycoside hydrolase n=1 Tax=Pluteus cervinus TaxID=181527 RepID=A0ACD3A920_9AGAR|nr:glycoside hydrolase [Pluteus cervinus]
MYPSTLPTPLFSSFSLLLITIVTLLSTITPAFAAPYCQLRSVSATSTSGPQPTGVSSSTGNSTSGGGDVEDVVAAAWYPGWLATKFPPSGVSWSKYTHATFAFGITTTDPSTIDLVDQEQTLTQFVTAAHQNNVKALLSIGGWTGSRYFSPAVTAENTPKFIAAITALVKQYNLDGIDFDWEYPGQGGIGCNQVTDDDPQNFMNFLQALRKDPVGQNLILSAAVGVAPFTNSKTSDLTSFGESLDWVAIMNYDVNGAWSSSTGANAPLNNCQPTPTASATQAFADWTKVNVPANKLVLGVPSYGRAFYVASSTALGSDGNFTSAFPNFAFTKPMPKGDNDDQNPTPDICGNNEGYSGTSTFHDLVGSFLTTSGTAAPGMVYQFDSCSQTPFIYDPTQGLLLSYDDAQSFAAKGDFINSNGLKGFSMWHDVGDYNDILINSISTAMNIEAGKGAGRR